MPFANGMSGRWHRPPLRELALQGTPWPKPRRPRAALRCQVHRAAPVPWTGAGYLRGADGTDVRGVGMEPFFVLFIGVGLLIASLELGYLSLHARRSRRVLALQ